MGRIWGLVFIAFGAVWCWDGWRLQTTQREVSMFDELGPDRYLIVLGIILVAVGASLLLKPPAALMARGPALTMDAVWPPRPPVTFTLALIAYTIILPLLGYAIATLLFFFLVFHIADGRRLPANLGYALVTTIVFYFVFDRFADMPLPAGPFGF